MGYYEWDEATKSHAEALGLADYDWAETIEYADGTKGYPFDVTGTDAAPVSGSSFGVLDIKAVIAKIEGENDGDSWLLLVELSDGRFGFVEAGCDYTGWG